MLIPLFTLALIFIVLAVIAAFRKRKAAQHQGKIARGAFVRDTFLEIIGILLAMAFAGLLSRYITQGATTPMSHDFAKILAGIIIGLLVGACVGLFMKWTWGRLVKI